VNIINSLEISQKYNLSPIISEVLEKRNKNKEWKLDKYLNPKLNDLYNPADIPHIKEFKKNLQLHLEFNDKIYIYGDYDVDGVTSATVLYLVLKEMGANVQVLISDRFKGGYSLSEEEIDQMKDADLIITVDCGINNQKEIEYINSKGIDIMVIDHHESKNIPECLFVDLKVEKNDYQFKHLSAGGLTWKICQYLINKKLYKLLDLVALSTIADLVPLWDENRIIVKEGLKRINSTKNVGLKELLNKWRIKNIDTGNIGFQIAPCINAPGRLENNQISFELLTTNDIRKAREISDYLFKTNEKRKHLTEISLNTAEEKINKKDNLIVIQGNFEPGIVGLIASDIANVFKKPALVFGKSNSDNICRGSGRSLSPLHMYDFLYDFKDYFINIGGHEKAIGCSIEKNKILKLSMEINNKLQGIKYDDVISYDIEISTKKINSNLIKELEIFSPTGMGNSKPKFLIEGEITNVSITKDQKHLKFLLDGIDCIGFNLAKRKKELKSKIIGCLEFNSWRGKKKIQINVKDIAKEK